MTEDATPAGTLFKENYTYTVRNENISIQSAEITTWTQQTAAR